MEGGGTTRVLLAPINECFLLHGGEKLMFGVCFVFGANTFQPIHQSLSNNLQLLSAQILDRVRWNLPPWPWQPLNRICITHWQPPRWQLGSALHGQGIEIPAQPSPDPSRGSPRLSYQLLGLGNCHRATELDNSDSASACVGMAITGVILLLVTPFLLSQQILSGSMSFNFAVLKNTYLMTCGHTE